jgi:hypothetical protein
MALTQGAQLPDVTTTQTQATTAPDWYSNYLSNLAQTGQEAVQAGGVAGFSPLQQQAFAGAPAAIQAGQPALQTATNIATGVGTTPFMQNVGQYMNPYTQSVIEDINRLGQRQFKETLAPGMTAGAVGSGQFGSQRGMQAYGNVARDVNRDILGKQAEYLAKGFDAATAAAKAQADLNLTASGRLGELSGIGYNQGIGGLDVLSKLGSQQQAQEQARLDYPMTAATKEAALLRGLQIPTTVSQTYKGPMPGAYQKSDLDYILASLAATGALFTPSGAGGTGATPISQIGSALSSIPGVQQLISGLGSIFGGNTGATGGNTGATGGITGGLITEPSGSYTTSAGEIINPSDYATSETGEGLY